MKRAHECQYQDQVTSLQSRLKESEAKLAEMRRLLDLALGACKSAIGYEPFRGTVEPYKCSERVAEIEQALSALVDANERKGE